MKCFYHSADLDGHCSGAIVKYRYPECEMFPINYGDVFPWDKFLDENEDVFMVDFCLQPFDMMQKLNSEIHLIWIDHHKSALDESYVKGFIASKGQSLDSSKAACELTWEYLFPDRPVPLAVKLLSLYDSWTYQGTVGDHWKELFGTSIDAQRYVEEGHILLRYDESQKAKYVQTYAFETILSFPYGLNAPGGYDYTTPEYDDFRAIAVNLGHTNSKMFDSVWKKSCGYCHSLYPGKHPMDYSQLCNACTGTGYIEPYELMISFCRRSDKLWNVSLYSTKPDIDCGAIAKSFGGGGHKGAAGFQCKELPFDY
jgi:oligoribonuclease NrnB/cAMP/cGMP phosphodiesterase (DHH superfamily)